MAGVYLRKNTFQYAWNVNSRPPSWRKKKIENSRASYSYGLATRADLCWHSDLARGAEMFTRPRCCYHLCMARVHRPGKKIHIPPKNNRIKVKRENTTFVNKIIKSHIPLWLLFMFELIYGAIRILFADQDSGLSMGRYLRKICLRLTGGSSQEC